MTISLHLDDIIYGLQPFGGISTYWENISRVFQEKQNFTITKSLDSPWQRFFPVFSNANIFHSSYFRTSLSHNIKNVVTVHDFLYQLKYLKPRGGFINELHQTQAIKSADAIICVSENTKRDLLRLFPDLPRCKIIQTIYHAPSFTYQPSLSDKGSQRLFNLSKDRKLEKYVFFSGKRTMYKQFNFALEGFSSSRLPKLGYKMICSGSKLSQKEESLIQHMNLTGKVIVLDNASHIEMNYLYQNAFALIYPSLYEGFGIPPLEAMSCGCPVIASNISSIPEVVGNAGLLVEPSNIMDIKNSLEKLLDSQTRDYYVRTGFERSRLFNWEKTAQEHIEVYKNLMNL